LILPFGMKAPILIIDDEPDVLELMAYGLGRKGWEVETAGNGADAMARMCGSRPSGIILDLMLPDIHGLGILEIARQLWVDDPVPVLVVSSLQSAELETEVMAAGASGFLPKPFILEDLVAAFERLGRGGCRRISSGIVPGRAERNRGERRRRGRSGRNSAVVGR